MYKLNQDFESVVAWLCVNHGSFWQRIGQYVVPDYLSSRKNRTVVSLCELVAANHPIPTKELVMQRAASQVNEGKLTEEDAVGVCEFVCEEREPDTDAVIREVAPVIRREMMRDLLERASKHYGNDAVFGDALIDEMRICDRLGVEVAEMTDEDTLFGDDTLDMVGASPMRNVSLLGIPPLDAMLSGGIGRSTVLTYIGDSGVGKTTALCHNAIAAILQGHNVAYLSTEIPANEIHRKLLACLTGTELAELSIPEVLKRATAKLTKYRRQGLGEITIHKCDPSNTTVEDVAKWYRKQEQKHGKRFPYRVLDYADMLCSRKRADQESKYTHGETVWSGLQAISKEDDGNWVITASQTNRSMQRNAQVVPLLDSSRIADSMHKLRLSDYVIGINPMPDASARDGFVWNFIKDRWGGQTGLATDTVPANRAVSRMANITDMIEAFVELNGGQGN